MSEKHNPTPWTSSGAYITDGNGYTIADTNGYSVADALAKNRNAKMRYANAARIVACVNACEGVDTEDLTIGCYQKLLDKHVEVCFAKQDAEAKCDELLAALKSLLSVVNVRIDDPRTQQFDAARAAIAKAEGAR